MINFGSKQRYNNERRYRGCASYNDIPVLLIKPYCSFILNSLRGGDEYRDLWDGKKLNFVGCKINVGLARRVINRLNYFPFVFLQNIK